MNDQPIRDPGSDLWWGVRRVYGTDTYSLTVEDRQALSQTPVGGGDQRALANQIGAAELQVGQFVYRRIEKLMGAVAGSPDGIELSYLADVAVAVEEYGALGDEDAIPPRYPLVADALAAQPLPEGEREWLARIITGEEKPPVGSYPSAHRAWNAALAKADQIIALRQNQSQGDGWRPIETAPRDGTPVFLICADAYEPAPFEGWFWDGAWVHYAQPEEKMSGGVRKWFPTHWAPKTALGLPAAPTPEQGG